uniref:Uncharacterized protein n=1 Tax=Cucumis melo TaxID=3656 RepID=A0A9I9ECE0_CUCME
MGVGPTDVPLREVAWLASLLTESPIQTSRLGAKQLFQSILILFHYKGITTNGNEVGSEADFRAGRQSQLQSLLIRYRRAPSAMRGSPPSSRSLPGPW